MFKIFKISFFLLLVVFLFFIISYYKEINKSKQEEGNDIFFTIQKGEGVKKIGDNLLSSNLINSKFYFEVYVWKNEKEKEFKAGEYILNPILSIKQIVKILTEGNIINNEKEIKIIEGWNSREISQYFEKEEMFQSEDFLETIGVPMIDYRSKNNSPAFEKYNDQFSFLNDKPEYYGLEGYLFPDTYRIFNDSTIDDVLLKMLNNFDKKLDSAMRGEIKKQEKTIYEIITMASIIEKEAQKPTERAIVSSVFHNRLKKRMYLEACTTVKYALEQPTKKVYLNQLEVDSPYNTYKNFGLPPGPICNPGIESIKAAIYPAKTNYYFFVAKPDGSHEFTRNFEEHQKARVKYGEK